MNGKEREKRSKEDKKENDGRRVSNIEEKSKEKEHIVEEKKDTHKIDNVGGKHERQKDQENEGNQEDREDQKDQEVDKVDQEQDENMNRLEITSFASVEGIHELLSFICSFLWDTMEKKRGKESERRPETLDAREKIDLING